MKRAKRSKLCLWFFCKKFFRVTNAPFWAPKWHAVRTMDPLKGLFKKLANARSQEIHVNYMFFSEKNLFGAIGPSWPNRSMKNILMVFLKRFLFTLNEAWWTWKWSILFQNHFIAFSETNLGQENDKNVLLVVWNCFLLLFVILRNEDGAAVIIRNGCPLVTCLVWLYNVIVPSELTEIVPANSSQFF